MLFSVDYRFGQGAPDRYAKYFWVIDCAHGRPIRREVQLMEKGTLQAVVPGLRPEVGPFRCHLEMEPRGQSRPTIISDTARMVSDNVPR